MTKNLFSHLLIQQTPVECQLHARQCAGLLRILRQTAESNRARGDRTPCRAGVHPGPHLLAINLYSGYQEGNDHPLFRGSRSPGRDAWSGPGDDRKRK